ncbi:Glutathione S-transferase [Actinidia chinensis var. chinensis]|uniref:glutathione transferase n=1 Tax=Actinidia chinensis var. chinensis TaxID=1590841 RepID=A0A2R6QWC6_ACTCC|nr:Glutathione S-transferase [Actinidia chinensis var. chinensis]
MGESPLIIICVRYFIEPSMTIGMANEVILLDYWPSPFAARVRIALAEKGIEYECKEEDLANKSPLLMKMNPIHHKVPVLIHNGRPICESEIIIQYIDDVWKVESPLLPSDSYLKAKARFWTSFINTKVHESGRKVWMSKGVDQETGKEELIEWCKLLEVELGDKPYFGGENFGFVDIALVPFYNWFNFFKNFADFNMEAECPKLVKWGNRCMERESVSKSLPNSDQMYAAFLEFKKMLNM